jgi:hypothetical protein
MPRGVDYVILLRRFAVLAALVFWQGGFTFYAAVVVPVGQAVLESHFEQGLITRQVTGWLNLAGAAALPLMALDLVATRDKAMRCCWARWAAWASMLMLLLALFWLRPHLDSLLDLDTHQVREGQRRLFSTGHRWYLWLSTIQWAFSVLFALLTLQVWRSEDRVAGEQAKGGCQNKVLSA